MALLRLIRLPNLLLLGLCQTILAVLFVWPALQSAGLPSVLYPATLSVLILATLCLAAAGYIFNDLQDLPTDRINRPDRPLPSGALRARQARLWLGIFVLTGGVLAIAAARMSGQWTQLWLYPAAGTGLYAYSARLKGRGLAGNLLIGLFCAAAAALPAWAEGRNLARLSGPPYRPFWVLTGAFLGFAFALTVFRELVKDLEDQEGDRQQGYRTFPVQHGQKAAKKLGLAIALACGTTALLLPAVLGKHLATWLWVTGCMGLPVPLFTVARALYRAENKIQFHRLSQYIKLAMLAGIGTLCLFATSIL